MFSSMVTLLFLFIYLIFLSATPVSIYNNAIFNPIDHHFLFANISSIGSQNACICQCLMNSMCITAVYNGVYKYCFIYFAQLYEGQLQLMTTDRISSVIYLRNKTILGIIINYNNMNDSDLINFQTRIKTPSMINAPNETVNGIWNTIAGGDSSIATDGTGVGNYNTGEPPMAVFDDIISTNYNNFGSCNISYKALWCGEKTGFYVTLKNGPSLLRAFRIRSGHYQATRDPLTVTFEGSNLPSVYLTLGSSWTLIYNGSSGLEIDPGRSLFGETQTISNNSIWYSSYRFLVTAKKNSEAAVEYSEMQFFGY